MCARSLTPAVSPADKPTPKRVTLRDIAKHLGVSHAAVSMAMRKQPGLSAALYERVRKTAAKLGYRPDPALVALNNYRQGLKSRPIQAALGWVTLWRDPAEFHAKFEFEQYWQGAKQTAEKHGYHLYEFSPDSTNSLAAAQRVMVARNIQGLLLSPPDRTFTKKRIQMAWRRFSVVRFGHSLADLHFHLVTSAQVSNTMLSIRRMRKRGYRRIGFVSSFQSNETVQFLHGFLRANEDSAPGDRLPPLSLPERSVAEDRSLLAVWLKQHRPEAVFSNLGNIHSLLTDVGCKIPEQLGLAVTSVQDCDADTGIDQSPFEIGKAACETLMVLLIHGNLGIPDHPREILVEGRWVDGTSLPRRRSPARVR